MNNKNSQIRAHARHLLDDNIFGADWLKGVLVCFLKSLISSIVSWIFSGIAQAAIVVLLIFGIFNNSLKASLFISIFVYLIALVLSIGLFAPFKVGVAAVYTDLVRNGEKVKVGKIFYGFKNFVSNVLLGVMYTIQIVVWSIFFIVPGIYVAYSYALVFYVKRDHPDFRWKQCFDESERLMDGNRWNLFKLQMGHIGYFIIGLAFVGIGAFWAAPYLNTSTAIFYENLRLEKGER